MLNCGWHKFHESAELDETRVSLNTMAVNTESSVSDV